MSLKIKFQQKKIKSISEPSFVTTTPQPDRRRESNKPTTEGPTKISLILAAATTTTQSTTIQTTSTRRPLRTTLSTNRPATPTFNYNPPHQPQVRSLSFILVVMNSLSYLVIFMISWITSFDFSMLHLQQIHISLLNLFAKQPNGPISMSINKFVDTSQKVVKGVEQIVKSTFEIITGAAGVDTTHMRY